MPTEPVASADPEFAADAPLSRAQLGWQPLIDRLRDQVGSWRQRLTYRPLVTAAAAVGLLGLGFGAWYVLRPPGPPPELALPRAAPATVTPASGPAAGAGSGGPTPSATSAATVTVDVVGAVARPGLVTLPGGSRVADAVEKAGGPASAADLERLNMAAALNDGERIYLPHLGETSIPVPVNGSGGIASGRPGDPSAVAGGASTAPPVDLNQADEQQLETLPGVGPSTAEAILDYRRQHGPFNSVDDLLNVRGIGPAKLAALRARARA